MIRLRGAREVGRLALKRWGSSTIFERGEFGKRSTWRYVRSFECPNCRKGDAFELFNHLRASGESSGWWGIDWTSDCGCVYDGVSSDSVNSRYIEVNDKNGALVGLVDTSPALRGEHWRRFEVSAPPFFLERCRSALFGTLWQAINAPLDEGRLLGSVQRHTGILWADVHTSMRSRRVRRLFDFS